MRALESAHPKIIQGGKGGPAFPTGGWRGLSLHSANLALYPERPSIISSPDGCRTAILTVICAAASITFPFPRMAERIRKSYFIPGGKRPGSPYKTLPMQAKSSPREFQELCIAANFVEIFLAREGHSAPVGINYLEKVQIPHLPSLYGAMLAGVAYVLMGAGIPVRIPAILDSFTHHQPANYPLQVSGALQDDDTTMTFTPRNFIEHDPPPLVRPTFLAIVASNTLATTIVKKANGRVDGLVIEGPAAGGHNAPPRGKLHFNPAGEPIYGERDKVDLVKVRELGLPFWLAGEYGSPEKLREALASGAAGVQVGTPFAFCVESGLARDYRQTILASVASGTARVLTDPLASPTHFPFKIVQMEGSLSEHDVYSSRRRICDLGYLREAYRTPEGAIGYRCAAEPVATYVAKGGKPENTVGRKCLCNALLANIGLPQMQSDRRVEKGLITAGNGLAEIARFLPASGWEYSAAHVVMALLDGRVMYSLATPPLDSEGVAVGGDALMLA